MSDANQISGEEEGGSLSPQIHEKAVNDAARAKGWKPLEEFEGDAADWVDSKEFVGRQKLYDRISGLKGELNKQSQQFQKDMQEVKTHFENVRNVEYQRALKQLQTDLKLAAADGDVAEVEQINKEITDLKVKEVEAKQVRDTAPKAEQTEEFVQWRSTNKWFDSDREMQQEAVAIGIGWAATNPNKTQRDMLDHVTTRMQKLYPEKFQTPQKKEKPVDSKVEGGTPNGSASVELKKGKKLTVADLSDQERSVMNTLIKRGALQHVATKEKISQQEVYLKQLAEAKGL
jgi:hypothetical protein